MDVLAKPPARRQPELYEPEIQFFADRVRVYPKAVAGPVRTVKWVILAGMLGIYYLLPWLRWDRGVGRPHQAVLLDLWHERFYFFNVELWPQDVYLLTGLLILGAVLLFLVTSLAGRLWCGYTCPQTLWTDLFMQAERAIEGDRTERMRRDAGSLTLDKAWRKLAKHGVWLFIAFWTGGAWIMYYVDAPTAVREFWTGTASVPVYFFTALFTATTYLLAGWAREQVCTYMCPWPRFQSAMFDDETFTVTYQAWRGEPRAKAHKGRHVAGAGDCIDCRQCVAACPTGIDIRDGIQLECIGCGLCVDACNTIMDRVERPRGLITWDNLTRQAAKKRGGTPPLHLLRPRVFVYLAVLTVALSAMTTAFLLRSPLSLSALHDRAPLFVLLHDGAIRNGYTLKVVNRTRDSESFVLTAEGVPGARLAQADGGAPPAGRIILKILPDSIAAFRVLVVAPAASARGSRPIEFELAVPGGGAHQEYRSMFLGPGQPPPESNR